MPKGGKAKSGAGKGATRLRIRKSADGEIESLVEDEEDNMTLASMIQSNGNGHIDENHHNHHHHHHHHDHHVSHHDEIGLGLGDFSGGMGIDSDPYAGFTGIGSLSTDPFGSMASMPDPFIEMASDNMNMATEADIESSGLLHPEPEELMPIVPPTPPPTVSAPASLPPPSKSKSKASRKSKPKPTPTTTSANLPPPAMSASRPITPLALTNLTFNHPPTPVFHRLNISSSSTSLSSLTRALSNLSSTDLSLLAKELGSMGRDARSRALASEQECKKLSLELPHLSSNYSEFDETSLGSELTSLLVHALDHEPSSDTLSSSTASSSSATNAKRKREDESTIDQSPLKGGVNSHTSSGKAQSVTKKKKGGGSASGAASTTTSDRTSGSASSGGKKSSATASTTGVAAATNGIESEPEDDEDEWEQWYDSDTESKPKKKKGAAMTEKEKQRRITQFWSDVDEHFVFPTQSVVQMMRPKPTIELYPPESLEAVRAAATVGAGAGAGSAAPTSASSNSTTPSAGGVVDPAFKIPPAGENWREVIERQKEEERLAKEKEAANSNSTATATLAPIPEEDTSATATVGGKKKKPTASSSTGTNSSTSSSTVPVTSATPTATTTTPSTSTSKKKSNAATQKGKTLSTALVQMGLDGDAKIKKLLLDTDKALGGDKTFYDPSKQSLNMRLVSMLIEDTHSKSFPPATQSVKSKSNGVNGSSSSASSTKDKKSSSTPSTAATATAVNTTTPTATGTNASGTTPSTTSSASAKKKALELTLEKRIEMELKYIGLLPKSSDYSYTRELSDRTDDELCANLRSAQKELSVTLESMNRTRVKLHPALSKLVGNHDKLTQLLEAETMIHRTYTQRHSGTSGKKKTLSSLHTGYNLGLHDAAIERALDHWHQTIRQTGTRRELTGFIPDPVDLGGIPRWRLREYPPARSYIDVIEHGVEFPGKIPRDAEGRPNFKHFIPPQHPNNPNYQTPPPPPPPPQPTQVPATQPPIMTAVIPSNIFNNNISNEPTVSSSKSANASSTGTGASKSKSSSKHNHNSSNSSSSSSSSSSNVGGHSHGHSSKSSHPSHPTPTPAATVATYPPVSSYPTPPTTHRQQSSSSRASHGSSSASSVAHMYPPPSHIHSIGSLPPLGVGVGVGGVGGANSYGLDMTNFGGDFHQSTGFSPPPSPMHSNQHQHHQHGMGMHQTGIHVNNGLSIGTLPPPDSGLGQFTLPSADFFNMDDI